MSPEAARAAASRVVVDGHQHFWDLGRFEYPWITPELEILRRPYGPRDLEPLLAQAGVSRTVLVQATSSVDETRALLEIAASTPFVAGVVGWVQLTRPDVGETLSDLRSGRGGKYLVGLRHEVHDEPDPAWLLRGDVQRGLAEVAVSGLAFDYLVRPRELPAALENARMHPEMRFVIDHLAKPDIAGGSFDPWERAMEPFSRLDNVSCKLSGMITQADRSTWTPETFVPYVRRTLDWFGEDRLLFGSDWPVCLLAGSYADVLGVLDHALGPVSENARSKIYAGNAVEFYGLTV